MRRTVWTAIAALTVGLGGLAGCQRGAPQLDGTWFVRYVSDPSPYLDVAFRGKQPKTVEVVLQGPNGYRGDLPLTWNGKDREWQIVPSLPDPLPGGVWWVSEVRATADGKAMRWAADSPQTLYTRTIDGQQATTAEAGPGFFYASEAGPNRVRIETMAPVGGRSGDPILAVYRDGDLTRWIAASDDYDVEEPYPTILMPTEPGVTYLIRVSGADDDAGDYAVRVVPEATPRMAAPTIVGATPDAHEPDQAPEKATTLELGTVLHRSLGGTRGTDVDWMRFVAPATPSAGE
ncbi:MAG: hypothetical protein KDA24_24130 [Deltaproteobacteria bacterium]|nr:hypothetical protein [Deltaproteobacteria bacterium]